MAGQEENLGLAGRKIAGERDGRGLAPTGVIAQGSGEGEPESRGTFVGQTRSGAQVTKTVAMIVATA